jgi:DNA-directed RNA polymerase subunit F
MMGLVYFIGIFFISLFGRLFSWLAHRYLLATSNTEHHIQSLFREIDESAELLENEKKTTILLLDAAKQNEWRENLMGKINTSTELLAKLAGTATDDSRKLRSLLESSKYKDIFNFMKYGNWVKKQILEPIESIFLLLEKNHNTIEKTLTSLDSQISITTDPSLQKPLILQKDRLKIQLESFERVMKMLEGYREKLS